MRAIRFSLLFLTAFYFQLVLSETITIQDCDDVTLGNSAYANDNWIEVFERPESDTLIIDQWRC
jgi:hypothetical protein